MSCNPDYAPFKGTSPSVGYQPTKFEVHISAQSGDTDNCRVRKFKRGSSWSGWLRSSVVRTSVSDKRTFPGLRSICSGCVTTYVGITSAIGQPTRPTQPFILPGSINEQRAGIRCQPFRWRHLANVRKVEAGMVQFAGATLCDPYLSALG